MLARLGLTSAYSFLYGVRKPRELAAVVRSLGAETLCIADRDNLYGVHTFIETAKEQGLRPVIGTALTVPHESGKEKAALYCFVQNRTGFSRLCEILTLRNRDKKNYDPVALLREHSAGLSIASGDEEVLGALAGKVTGPGVPRLYGAVTPSSFRAVSASRKHNLPLAFLDDSLFLEKEDYRVHRALRAIALNKTVGNLQEGDAVEEGTGLLLPDGELDRRLRSWPDAYRGTAAIAAECTYHELFDGFVFPGYGADGREG
ncbi:MAG: PHP domain-containing protein, partial [Treponema sp.]|nr:PHP domain-containing protein [Treponema sp.]